ncbi:unnamed protein product [Macrosiphum euphorbiae]|uniref:Uncharacterized protein n=1 Tax=Macrosiphum euphorbiae TaxID=13131 RepID=A0AAV0WC18_9HEMI|nr:unnamed protein product [Macrosiphum euphorbiae]
MSLKELTYNVRFRDIGSENLAPVCTRHSTQTGTVLTRVAHRQTHSLRFPPAPVRPRMQLTHFGGLVPSVLYDVLTLTVHTNIGLMLVLNNVDDPSSEDLII